MIALHTDCAGRWTFDGEAFGYYVSVHLLPRKRYRSWGYREDWYDGPLPEFGLGPLLLVCWMEWR